MSGKSTIMEIQLDTSAVQEGVNETAAILAGLQQIAASTAAWIANTAVKVVNTAAQWAQIAATTAWNALCAVATTVTTAQQALADVLAQQGNDIHIRFTGDLAQLGRVLKPVIDRENRRVGGSLAKGAV